MATTKVIIRKKRINDKGMTPIFIRYTHHEVSILISVGQMINPEHWDDAGMVKRTVRGYSNINALIEKRKRVVDDIRIELQLADVDPTIERVKDALPKEIQEGPLRS